jgi:hypothetical protein
VNARGAGRRALLVVLAAPVAALAHHSISGVYDSGRQVTVEGRVVEFQFVNPHPVLVVAAATASGDVDGARWRLEMDNRYELADIGVTAKTFKTGEDALAAAIRETREETGVDDLDFAWGHDYCETAPYARGKVARYYLARTRAERITLPVDPTLGRPEHHEYRWVDLTEAFALTPPRLRRVVAWAAGKVMVVARLA